MSEYRDRVDEMPTFEEYAAAREKEFIAELGENFDEAFDNPAEAKRQRLLNYHLAYLMELGSKEANAKAAEEEAEQLTREYNAKMAALKGKHRIEHTEHDNILLGLIKALRENED